MSENTARRYRTGPLPSQRKVPRQYRTRPDPFAALWPEIEALLVQAPGLEAPPIFKTLRGRPEGPLTDGQLRTLQRHIRRWRTTHGPEREVMFPQVHRPGEYAQSDFTAMGSLGITLNGQPLDHLFYHFVLQYSNWQTGALGVSESFEALIAGFQAVAWELGRVPAIHQTDSLSAATHDLPDGGRTFNKRYRQVWEHYKVRPDANPPGRGHENGDGNKPIIGSREQSSRRCCSGASAISRARPTMRSFCGQSLPGGIDVARRHSRKNSRTCTPSQPCVLRISACSE